MIKKVSSIGVSTRPLSQPPNPTARSLNPSEFFANQQECVFGIKIPQSSKKSIDYAGKILERRGVPDPGWESEGMGGGGFAFRSQKVGGMRSPVAEKHCVSNCLIISGLVSWWVNGYKAEHIPLPYTGWARRAGFSSQKNLGIAGFDVPIRNFYDEFLNVPKHWSLGKGSESAGKYYTRRGGSEGLNILHQSCLSCLSLCIKRRYNCNQVGKYFLY